MDSDFDFYISNCQQRINKALELALKGGNSRYCGSPTQQHTVDIRRNCLLF